ncbi:MAG: hypothetical protein U1F63_02665 [Chitinivorax sp.]
MGKLVGIVEFIQGTVEKGANTVEGVHRSLAAKPYEALKSVPPLNGVASSVQALQDSLIGGFYDVVRAVSSGAGETAKVVAERIEGGAEQQDKDRIWK